METFIKGLSASYLKRSETLRIYRDSELIFEHCIEDCSDMDYWHSLYFGDDVYDINLHRHSRRLSLQMYPVIGDEVNGSIWQDIPLKVIKIKI